MEKVTLAVEETLQLFTYVWLFSLFLFFLSFKGLLRRQSQYEQEEQCPLLTAAQFHLAKMILECGNIFALKVCIDSYNFL